MRGGTVAFSTANFFHAPVLDDVCLWPEKQEATTRRTLSRDFFFYWISSEENKSGNRDDFYEQESSLWNKRAIICP